MGIEEIVIPIKHGFPGFLQLLEEFFLYFVQYVETDEYVFIVFEPVGIELFDDVPVEHTFVGNAQFGKVLPITMIDNTQFVPKGYEFFLKFGTPFDGEVLKELPDGFFLFFIVDLIVKKDMNRLQDNLKKLWVWMGNYFNNIIVLISVASVFAEAIKKLKGIDVLCGMLSHIGGAVIIVAIAMAAIQIGTALLTGSSNAPWYAFGSMGADMAATLGVHNGLLLVPMHLTGGLSRCFSPFCGAMIAVSGMVEAEPLALCKRNAVPMLFGVLVCFIATFVVFGL